MRDARVPDAAVLIRATLAATAYLYADRGVYVSVIGWATHQVTLMRLPAGGFYP
jgi:hypothetical protein